MSENATVERTLKCGSKQYTVREHPDGIVGVYDAQGKLLLGWPETVMLSAEQGRGLSDEEWCGALARLRPGR